MTRNSAITILRIFTVLPKRTVTRIYTATARRRDVQSLPTRRVMTISRTSSRGETTNQITKIPKTRLPFRATER